MGPAAGADPFGDSNFIIQSCGIATSGSKSASAGMGFAADAGASGLRAGARGDTGTVLSAVRRCGDVVACGDKDIIGGWASSKSEYSSEPLSSISRGISRSIISELSVSVIAVTMPPAAKLAERSLATRVGVVSVLGDPICKSSELKVSLCKSAKLADNFELDGSTVPFCGALISCASGAMGVDALSKAIEALRVCFWVNKETCGEFQGKRPKKVCGASVVAESSCKSMRPAVDFLRTGTGVTGALC